MNCEIGSPLTAPGPVEQGLYFTAGRWQWGVGKEGARLSGPEQPCSPPGLPRPQMSLDVD